MIIWKILDVHSEDEMVTKVRYHAEATDGKDTVQTEGWIDIPPKEPKPAFNDIRPETVVVWVKEMTTKDGVNVVESRLNEQLTALKKAVNTKAPWHPPDTFKVRI